MNLFILTLNGKYIMGFLDERPVAKIVSGATLIISVAAIVSGIVPAENIDALMILAGASGGFLFAGTSTKLS